MTRSKPNNSEPNEPTFLDCAPLESSTPLEASTPLDYRDEVKPPALARITADVSPVTSDLANVDAVQRNALEVEHNEIRQQATISEPTIERDLVRQESSAYQQARSPSMPTIVEEKRVQLLEERLVVDRKKRKVGEVIVRKVIETHIIEVPVRREKLLIEQIGSEPRQLASIDLGQPVIDGVEFTSANTAASLTVSGEFASIKAASQFLATIAASQPDLGYQTVQVRIVADNVEQQQLYQQWLDRYLDSQRQ